MRSRHDEVPLQPGGSAEVGESPRRSAGKELLEASEILEVGFFREGALPELSGRIRPEQLAPAFAHHRDPTLQPVFE